MSMVIVMPDNMEEFEKKYMKKQKIKNDCKLKEIFNSVRMVDAESRLVRLPKFKIEKDYEMNEQLKKMNLGLLFKNGANFNRMTDQSMHVSQALHKCVVEVDEKGTEAAAVTVIINSVFGCAGCFGHFEPTPVIIDKPFYFAIIGGKMEIPLFFGKITNPKA